MLPSNSPRYINGTIVTVRVKGVDRRGTVGETFFFGPLNGELYVCVVFEDRSYNYFPESEVRPSG